MKYVIKARIEIEGNVDRPDIIGAIFGQTEGLFGQELDLRILQERGRIGRIYVETRTQGNKVVGEILVPSNLDRVETALVAAMIESIDKVGPYNAKVQITDIVDMRIERIKKIVERAKEILNKWAKEKTPDLKQIVEEIESSIKIPEPIAYGPEKLPAGPEIDSSDTIILVEGRADVINMLRYGYKNVISVEGAQGKVPETIARLAQRKTVIAFVDGDRGGDMILKTLLKSVKIDYIARAPQGKEVEQLTGKEIERALKNMVAASEYLKQIQEKREVEEVRVEEQEQEARATQAEQAQLETLIEIPDKVAEDAKTLIGTLTGILYDASWNPIEKLTVRDLYERLSAKEPGTVYAVVFDGIITQRMIDIAKEKRIKLLVGARIGSITGKPEEIEMLTFSDIGVL
ncbi:MAG: DNA primase DnaG [Desulfurococcales archaeon]|jgi:DNA primase|nr:DNA primase DnaG [Desulfurococcales archaeon]